MTIERSVETPSSVIAYGHRGDEPVVLKISKHPGDEWRAGAVLRAFGDRGVVRVLELEDGAVLLERLDPATPLVDLVRHGDDEGATHILCDVIEAMRRHDGQIDAVTVHDWARGFARYVATGDTQIPRELVARAHDTCLALCASQRSPRLLHGDLHHYNVLYDFRRGWTAIDPKGVVGELEYEIGAVLRNPTERPAVFTARSTAERRIATFASRLNLDAERTLAWAFSQAVLSAIWAIEDGDVVTNAHSALALAATLRPMLVDIS